MKAVKPLLLVTVLTGIALLGGCMPHIKVVESYESTTTPNDKASGKTIDPYTYGGTAAASGGTHTQSSYSDLTPKPAESDSTPKPAEAAAPAPVKKK